MRQMRVYRNGTLAGCLIEYDRHNFVFRYDDLYYNNSQTAPVSLTLLKTQQEHHSQFLFPFFSNMVAEGANLAIQSRYLKIDEKDVISLLHATAETDTIGAITVKLVT